MPETPSAGGWKSLLRSLAPLASWVALEVLLREQSTDSLKHLADQLNGFASRNQLSIELLPPALSSLKTLSERLGYDINPLQLSRLIGTALELCVVQCLLSVLGDDGFEALTYVADILVVSSALFLWSFSSLALQWLACTLVRIVLFWRDIARTDIPLVWLWVRLVIVIVFSTACQVAFITITVSLCLPGSEVAYGGNYNLRYLDADWRRAMRPEFDIPNTLNASGPGLHSMTPYSIYIPSGGFLWTDELVWSPELGSFADQVYANVQRNSVDNDDPEDSSNDFTPLGHRVIMKDPIGRFSPWLLQKDLDHSLNNGLEQDVLLQRERAVLRSADSKHFLAVSSRSSHLEPQVGIDDDALNSGRLAVFMSPTYNAEDAVFQVTQTDKGFRLYHPYQGCYLATTFRSFPDYAGVKLNDSMLHELHLELEVACVRQADVQASTLYIVDGYQSPETDRSQLIPSVPHLRQILRPLMYHLKRGAAVIASMRRLSAFRRLHHNLQDTPSELLFKPSQDNAVQWPLLTGLLPGLFILILALYKQRTGKSAEFWSSRKGHQLFLVALSLVHQTDDSWSSHLELQPKCSRCLALFVCLAFCYLPPYFSAHICDDT